MEVERRLYIGNLPSGVDENLIKNRFSKYGKVLGVELKQRKTNDGSQEDEILSTFAFIDISAKKEKLDSCLKKLSRKKWDGQLIKIDFAKESVLSRLERERKELSSAANNTKNTTKEMNKDVSVSPALLNGNSKWFGSSARNYNGEEFEEEHKQKNKRKLESDNTQINEKMEKYSKSKTVENGVNDVIVKSSSFQENLTPEQRRLKSLEEKMKMVSDRKLAVKAALSSVDAGNRKNKIIFKDDDDEDDDDDDDDDDEGNDFNEPENKTHTTNLGKAPDIPDADPSNKERHNLFDDSGDSDEETSISRFEVKEHFDGKKGQKLLKLQSRFGNDSRFALDQRFAESSSSEDDDDDDGDKDEAEEKEEDGESESKAKKKKSDAEEESGKMHVDDRDDDEVKRQLEILQNVVGHQIIRPPPADDAKPKKQKTGADKKRNQLCVRFDPTMAEHEKFIVKPPPPGSEEETKVSKKKKKNKNAEESDEKEPEVDKSEAESSTAVNSVEVSKETYYEVASDLKERLKSSGTGFSLSQLFSSDAKSKNDIEDDDWVQSRDKSKEGASISNKQSVGAQENNDRVSEKTTSQNKTSGLSKLWKESFFFKDNDDRLKEGADFFMRNRGQDASKNFSDRRQELKLIVKSKMKRNMRKDRMFKKKIGGGFPSKTQNFSRKRVGRFT